MAQMIKVQVWSDVVCPFCYIGKRRFEQALRDFPQQNLVEIEWKSFQLDPDLPKSSKMNVYGYLANRYGRDLEWAKAMHENVTKMAAEVGLTYRFDLAQVANSFDAHRMEHLAKKFDLGNEMVEQFFKAYFQDGKDISSLETMIEIGTQIGLNQSEIERVFNGSDFGNAVRQDIVDAQQLGIRGVPFFVFNGKYGISGAQPKEEFLKVLEQCATE